MGDLLLSVLVVFLFAWVARALVGAQELTWGRTVLAALAGIGLGDGPLLRRLPRHVDRIATLVEHGQVNTRVRLFGDPAERGFSSTWSTVSY